METDSIPTAHWTYIYQYNMCMTEGFGVNCILEYIITAGTVQPWICLF